MIEQKFEDGIANLRMAIELNPNNAHLYMGLGSALTMQRKYPEAISKFEKARQLDPTLADSVDLRLAVVKMQQDAQKQK